MGILVDDFKWEEEFPNIPLEILSDKQREVIVLRYCFNMSFGEIATETKRPKPHVVRSHTRAIVKLEKYISEALDELDKSEAKLD